MQKLKKVIKFKDYVDAEIHIRAGTLGGDTFFLNDVSYCFAFTSSHRRAVKALTNGKNDYQLITYQRVDRLVDTGEIVIDEAECAPDDSEYGYLGAKVWDAESGDFIGQVGNRCGNPAGWGTNHESTGRCRLHNGNNQIFKVSKGLVSRKQSLRQFLADKITAYAQMDRPLDLSRELASQRALLDTMMVQFDQIQDPGKRVNLMQNAMQKADLIGRQAERITRMNNSTALTAAHVLLIQQAVAQVLTDWIPDPHNRELALQQLGQLLGLQNVPINPKAPDSMFLPLVEA